MRPRKEFPDVHYERWSRAMDILVENEPDIPTPIHHKAGTHPIAVRGVGSKRRLRTVRKTHSKKRRRF